MPRIHRQQGGGKGYGNYMRHRKRPLVAIDPSTGKPYDSWKNIPEEISIKKAGDSGLIELTEDMKLTDLEQVSFSGLPNYWSYAALAGGVTGVVLRIYKS